MIEVLAQVLSTPAPTSGGGGINPLAIIGTVLGILVALGGLVAVIKSGLARGRVEALEKENESIRRHRDDLEKETLALRAEVAELKGQLEFWRAEATGSAFAKELEKLTAEVRQARNQEHETHQALTANLVRAAERLIDKLGDAKVAVRKASRRKK